MQVPVKVEVHEKKIAQKIEKYVKFNRSESFFILRIFFFYLSLFQSIETFLLLYHFSSQFEIERLHAKSI